MFESLSDRLSQSLKQITGKARLTDENIADALRDVRMALLEADVALSVVKDFIEQVRTKAIGQAVTSALNSVRRSSRSCTMNWCISWVTLTTP